MITRSDQNGLEALTDESHPLAQGHASDRKLRVQELDPRFLPGGKNDAHAKRRLVFVGDVHGCHKSLMSLLRAVDFREDLDHLVLTGDVVTKGPDNIAVLDELIRLNATSVRGNHENSLLLAAEKMFDDITMQVNSDAIDIGKVKDKKLLKQLKPRHFEYLRSMPLVLHIPRLPKVHKSTSNDDSRIGESILVVHAGLVPGLALHHQDANFVMNMRSIHRKTRKPSAEAASKSSGTEPWSDTWNWYNGRLFRGKDVKSVEALRISADEEDAEEDQSWLESLLNKISIFSSTWKALRPQVVVYGHDSRAGLQIKRWSKGLDSGCVSGGRLTALILDAKGRQELKSVECENQRT